MKLKVNNGMSTPSLFCGYCVRSNHDVSLSESLLEETRKSNDDCASSPISTARYTDEGDEDRVCLDGEVPLQDLKSRRNENGHDTKSDSPANRTRPTWKNKILSLKPLKKLGWNTRNGYKQVDDSLPDDVLPILFRSSAEKDTSLDFLLPVQHDNRLTLSLISAGSSLLNLSLDAECHQLEFQQRTSKSMTKIVPTTMTMTRTGDVSKHDEEESRLGVEVDPTDALSTPYPFVLSSRLKVVSEKVTAPNRPADVCQDDLKAWKNLDLLARSFQRPLIQKPTIIERKPIYSIDEGDDEELSFANSESSLLFDMPGSAHHSGYR